MVRPATLADMQAFYGDAPFTLRAYVAEMDGTVEGVIGVKRDIDHGLYFSDFSEKLRPYLRSMVILRAIKSSLELVRGYRGPVYTIASDAEACRLLNRLGFAHIFGEWYAWLN